ncbi:gluconokinase [Knoellia aerolata]|uniref:Carbohydrate kinase n=1 Tax=Knoellia aerolata DSM 18566 TaxID=1385519 RepID=A0A0A0JUG1_9MICO|nr:gluconokinase [Knoellia aerolata]KGN40783.1 carbohydrate kinase [Knoellia aerolata DSM 18566]
MTTSSPYPPAEVVIGLDVGTTGTKAVAFGMGSPWRHTVVREYPLLAPGPGWQVQDPATVVAAVMGALAEVVTTARGARVVGISVSTAMHALIGLDEGLRPLTPIVTWADSRATAEAAELRSSDEAEALHLASGTPLHPMSPLAKLLWFTRHEPALAARVRAWVGLKDYVLQTLTGTSATELSTASGSGLLDLATRTWNPRALELAGIREDQLPPILPTTAVLGLTKSAASRLGLATATPVVVGAGDGPLGNLGTGALDRGVVGLSVGTSGAARMVVPAPVTDPSGRLFCYALTDDAWVVGGAVSNGGIVVRWARDVLGDAGGDDAALLELAASVPAGSDGLVVLPYLLAERAPLWDPTLTGAIIGMRHSHTRGHVVRAVVEGVALQLWSIVDGLDAVTPVTSIRATGGVFRSQVWRDVTAGVLARPVTVTGGAEGSALGAAALGLLAVGRASSLTDGLDRLAPGLRRSGDAVVVDDADRDAYRAARARIPSLLDSYAAVADLFRTPARAGTSVHG